MLVSFGVMQLDLSEKLETAISLLASSGKVTSNNIAFIRLLLSQKYCFFSLSVSLFAFYLKSELISIGRNEKLLRLHKAVVMPELLVDHVHSVFRTEMERRWQEIFKECSTDHAKHLSKHDRKEMNLKTSNLVYGEVSFEALAEVLFSHVNLPDGGIFYDLGYDIYYFVCLSFTWS